MKISKRGVLTVPKELRKQYHLQPGTEMEWLETERGLVLRRKLLPHDRQEQHLRRARDER